MKYKHIFLIFCSLFIVSCAPVNRTNPEVHEEVDFACSYFYFLWGTHAEYHEQYAEALEAYEKALICDPTTVYVKEKLPLLLLKMGDYEKAADYLRKSLQNDPENTSYCLLLANIYVQQNKTDKAITLYKKIIAVNPEDRGVQLRLGLLYTHQHRLDKAGKIFRQLLKSRSDSYFGRLYLARLLTQTDKTDEAAGEYEKALLLNWSKDLAFEIGYFYMGQGLYHDAVRIFTTITDNDPLDERALLGRVQSLLSLSKDNEALKVLRTLKACSSQPAVIDLIISKILLKNNNIAEAKAILSHLNRATDTTEVNYLLALLAYRENDLVKAHDYLQTIKADDEQFEDAVYLQTRIFRKEGKLKEAVAMLEKLIGRKTTSSPLFYAVLSVLYRDNGDNQAAISLLHKATTLYPDNYQLYFEYGITLEKEGMIDRAVEAMETVIKLRPDHPEALNFVGYTWADRNIHLRKALSYIQKAIKQKPDNGYIMDSLGWIYYRLGQLNKAAEILEQSIILQPEDPYIYEHLGDVYRSQHNYSKALETYLKAKQLSKDKEKLSAIQKKIDSIPEVK